MTGRSEVWRDAEERPRMVVRLCPLPPECGGGVHARYPDGSIILVDRNLNGPDREGVLAHELAHADRGGVVVTDGMPTDWRHVATAEEARCWRLAAERLVPTAQLSRWCDQQAELAIGVGPNEVMVEYEVSRRVAEAALDNLTRWERATGA